MSDKADVCLRTLTNINHVEIDAIVWEYLVTLDRDSLRELRDRINLISFIIDEFKDRFYFEP